MARKTWYKSSRSAKGEMVVTCTVQDDNLTSKWSTKTYQTRLTEGLKEADKNAHAVLDELAESVAYIENARSDGQGAA